MGCGYGWKILILELTGKSDFFLGGGMKYQYIGGELLKKTGLDILKI